MKENNIIEIEIDNAVEVLKKGGVILYPTDTIWGIGCDATNKQAVDKIYQIKNREKNKSMIVLMENSDQIKEYVKTIPSIAFELIKNCERPTTIIYPGAIKLADNVIAADGSIAIRIPDNEFCKRLIKVFSRPIVSTSANFSGETSAISFDKISPALLVNMDYIVQIMHNQIITSKPSRILKLNIEGSFQIIRD